MLSWPSSADEGFQSTFPHRECCHGHRLGVGFRALSRTGVLSWPSPPSEGFRARPARGVLSWPLSPTVVFRALSRERSVVMASVSGRRFQSTLPHGGVVMATAFGQWFQSTPPVEGVVMATVLGRWFSEHSLAASRQHCRGATTAAVTSSGARNASEHLSCSVAPGRLGGCLYAHRPRTVVREAPHRRTPGSQPGWRVDGHRL